MSDGHGFFPRIKPPKEPAFTVSPSGTLRLGPPRRPDSELTQQERYDRIRHEVHHLGDSAVQRYGDQLMADIHEFHRQDTFDKAREEGRLVYRSWPQDSASTNTFPDVNNPHAPLRNYTSGYDSLTTTRDPTAFRAGKTAFHGGMSDDPLSAAPATLLGRDPTAPDDLWSGSGPGMVASLLPEEFYVRFEAFNARTKQRDATPALRDLGKEMRARVTRPTLFDNKDLSSGIMTMQGKTKRYGKPSMGSLDPVTDKQTLQRNAIEYQSFMATHPSAPGMHNEMAVKFRETGLFAPAVELTHQQRVKTTTVPDLTILGKTITTKQVHEPYQVLAPEDPARAVHAATLAGVLGVDPHPYPVIKR